MSVLATGAAQIRASRRVKRRWLAVALVVITGVGVTYWRLEPSFAPRVIEYPMLVKTDIPTAVAVAPEGAVWFTIELSDAIGVLRDGKIHRLPKGTPNLEPLGLAVDASGGAWYTDTPARAIARMAPDGTIRSFPLASPVARMGRLAVAADGTVWFADATTFSITSLKNGVFTRHDLGPSRASPFAVAVAADGTVWATLQEVNKLLRLSRDGQLTEFDVPTRLSGLGDVAVDPSGAVWFIETRANKIGQFEQGSGFAEFAIPTPAAAPTALAVAPDGAIWFTELRAQKLGRLHDGRITEFRLPQADARPFSIAVDAENNVWYTDLSGRLAMLAFDRGTAR
jgi:virginiamycin B lyase